jgi:hypothetical protein
MTGTGQTAALVISNKLFFTCAFSAVSRLEKKGNFLVDLFFSVNLKIGRVDA